MKVVFVKWPKITPALSFTEALRLTAKNGKALRLPYPASGTYKTLLHREGLVLTQTKRGKLHYVWCENGSKTKGGR